MILDGEFSFGPGTTLKSEQRLRKRKSETDQYYFLDQRVIPSPVTIRVRPCRALGGNLTGSGVVG